MGSNNEEADRAAADPVLAVEFNKRRFSAYDVWVIVRALNTDENVPRELWPDDYNQILTMRPVSYEFVRCRLCTMLCNDS